MNSLKSLYSRIGKLKAGIPTPVAKRLFLWTPNYALFHPQEQTQLKDFFASLPHEYELSDLPREQFHTLGHWLRLEDALTKGDVAKAEEMRVNLCNISKQTF